MNESGHIHPDFQSDSEKEQGEITPDRGTVLFEWEGIHAVIPDRPWLTTYNGTELRTVSEQGPPLVSNYEDVTDLARQVSEVARTSLIAAEIAGVFAEVSDAEKPDWYGKQWFNLNINSHLGGQKLNKLTNQVYLRPRTRGQVPIENQPFDPDTAHPAWGVPVPVRDIVDSTDKYPYSAEEKFALQETLATHFDGSKFDSGVAIHETPLFTDEEGQSSLDSTFDFQIGKGNYPVWSLGEYLLVTQDNPLVDREDGVHLVLIYRGEQQGPEERFNFPWRDMRRTAEMITIAAAASKILTKHGYADRELDKSYIHMNANWSLGSATYPDHPSNESDVMWNGQMHSPTRWPGADASAGIPAPNIHPHIQLLRRNEGGQEHDLFLPATPDQHARQIKAGQTNEEIAALRDVLGPELTELVALYQGKTLAQLAELAGKVEETDSV